MAGRHNGGGPRKVTVGTGWMRPGEWRGLEDRLGRLAARVDEMARLAQADGRRLDIALLPEDCNSGGSPAEVAERAEDPCDGPTVQAMAEVARRHATYLVVPIFAREGGRVYNSAALLGRDGSVVGRYDKIHGAEEPPFSGLIEGGCAAGARARTWDLDFGRVGIQICFDLLYDDGWLALEEAGAELVLWPSAYPGLRHLGYRAWRHGYHVVAGPWRPPCTMWDAAGHAIASTGEPDAETLAAAGDGKALVATIDLEYRLMHWQTARDWGKALREKYGERIGMRWHTCEDVWVLWSNDESLPVDRLMQDEGLETMEAGLERQRRLQDAARGGPVL